MPWSFMFISWITLCSAVTDLKGTTSQSSTYVGTRDISQSAIDGRLLSCARTTQEPNSWWRIDLLGIYRISSISIHNQKRLGNITGARIYIGNSCEKNGTTNHMCETIKNFELGTWNNFTFNQNISGRYITVFSPENRITLCEVKIVGTIKESPFELIRENKTWEDALCHCRDRDMDLASVVDDETQAWAALEAGNAGTSFVWLGLRYTHTLKFSVNDQCFTVIEESDLFGAMNKESCGTWFSKSNDEKFNFICAKDKTN